MRRDRATGDAKRRRDRAALARAALEQARGGADPDPSRLVAEVPSLMARARRARGAEPTGLAQGLAVKAWRLMPGLSAATAAAVVIACLVLFLRAGSESEAKGSLDTMFLGEPSSASSSTGDPLLDAVLDTEKRDGR